MPGSFKFQLQTILTSYYRNINAVQGASGDQSRQVQLEVGRMLGPKADAN
jgi:hypothetical protein